MRKNLFVFTLLTLLVMPSVMKAQRIMQELGRGVVAVYGTSNGSAGVEITWRRLAQEPEDVKYNVYVSQAGDDSYTLLNDSPLTNTNYATTLAKVPYGSQVAVRVVVDGLEKELSKPFKFTNHNLRNVYMEIRYDKSPLDKTKYTTKFVWPCDLNGDGEMDYVVDRLPVDGSQNRFVEGYLADGTFLWNIDLGPNEVPSDGQNDNMCAYDIDCDGLGELVVQTSDGTRFWDKEKGTWGKYVMGKSTGDTDGDGVIDYNSHATKNPPRYMTVVNGMTGAEKASAEFMYDDAYNRTNKADLMGDEYNKHEAHVGIFYHDGVHPAICGEWTSRTTAGQHKFRNCAFSFDFTADGKATNWHQLFMKGTGGAVFHQIRIADVDGDGKDEMLSGAYAMDYDGSTLYNTGIAHGDRHRTSDIDPEHPGLETFSIQQNAGDMLGMILFDAANGNPLKKWFLPAVGDVGRGECMDLDPAHIGWEMFSTMDGYQMYDAQGNKIEGKTGFFPTEGLWWDGQLDRERVDTPDGSGYNAMIVDYTNGRLIEMAKESGWTLKTSNAKRGKFWGDIIGDWREELIVIREENGVCQGIVGFSTDYKTSVDNIYCLMQDPHYMGDCTTRGYYQSPNPGFYLGYDMPRPPLPPCMTANEESDVFGIASGNATITPHTNIKNLYVMPVKGQTLTLNEKIGTSTTLWKSQQGELVVNANVEGKTVVSEGTVCANTQFGTVDLRARGTLSGSATVDTIICEGALNYEGCRLMPNGVMTVKQTIVVPAKKRLFVELTPGHDKLCANVDTKGTVVFTINADMQAGEYVLMEGCQSINVKQLSVRGLTGKSYSLKRVDDESNSANTQLILVIHEQREATTGVTWTGAGSGTWDYQTANFSIAGENTNFVAGDQVEIGDAAVNTTITLPVLYPTSGVTFTGAKTFTIQGNGGFSGEGGITVDMNGSVAFNTTHSDYTGIARLKNGTVTVKDLADSGIESSLGAGNKIELGKAKLIVNNSNTGTNRQIDLTDEATIHIADGTTSLKGQVTGNGTLVKTGNGQLNITYAGANSWTATILQSGKLAMGAWNTTFGKATSPIHVTGNATIVMFDCNSSSTMPSVQNTIEIDKGKTLTFNAGSRCYVKGKLAGEGTFKISFPYVRGDVSTNTSTFEGTYEVATSNCRFVQAMDLSKATLKLDDNAYAAGVKAGSSTEQSYSHKLGSIAGTGTLGTGTWNIGYCNTNDTFAGKFNAAAVVNKCGTGTLSLTGASECTINVNEGTLMANNTTASTTTGSITVKAGALLAGNGQVQNVTVQKDGTVGAGKGNVTNGTLTVNGNLTVNTGGKVRMRYRSTTTKTTVDALKVEGNVKLMSPTIEVTSLNDTEIVDDAELKLFTGKGNITLTGDVTFIPATPKAGWLWDTSSLVTDGVIRITADPTAIVSVALDKLGNVTIYDLQGRKVENPVPGNIYIVNGRKVCLER